MKRCDRCGREISGPRYEVIVDGGISAWQYTLCGDCWEEVRRVLEGGDGG